MAHNILLLVKSLFKKELEALGHRVVALAFEGEYDHSRRDQWSIDACDGVFRDQSSIFEILDQIAPFRPDYILYHDDSSSYIRVCEMHKCPLPTIFYSVDTHIHGTWHSYVSGMFDHTFVAQRSYMHAFQVHTNHVSWLPLWAPRRIEPSSMRDIPICFRGTLELPQRQQRVDFLRAVAQAVPLDYAQGDFEEAFSRAEIVLNEQIRDDVNFRVFEAIMCGACLVTPRSPNGLAELFVDNQHLVTYEPRNPLDAIDKLRALMDDPLRRGNIARAGRDHLLSHHLAKNRADVVESILQSLTLSRSPQCAQMALYNLVRWWGVVHGRFDCAPEPLIMHLLSGLEEVAASDAPLGEETIFVGFELAGAHWSGPAGVKLCEILSNLGRRKDRNAQTLSLAASYALTQLDGSEGGQLREIERLFNRLYQASPFRIFDRPGTPRSR